MRRIKHFILLMISLISGVIMCSGCGRTHEEQTEEMLAHMYGKYGVEFQVDWESNNMTGYDSYNLSLKGNTDEALRGMIEVEYWFESDTPYRDNYFLLLAQPVVQERVENALGDSFPYKMQVEIRSNLFEDDKYRSAEQFDEYLEERGDDISGHVLFLMVQNQGSEEANIRFEQEVKEFLRGAEIGNLWLVFVCVKEEDFEVLDFNTPLNSLQEVYTYRSNKNLYDE